MHKSLDNLYAYQKRFIISKLGEDYIQAGNEMRYQCPFCKELGKRYDDYKLYVSIPQGVYFCFRCNNSAKLDYDPMLIEGSYGQNIGELLDQLRSSLSPDEDKSHNQSLFRIPATEPQPGTKAWDYIISRNITPVHMSEYNIRVDNLLSEGRFRHRFIIPNKVYSNLWTDMYVARAYDNSPKRYLNPSSSRSHDLVFNLDRIQDNPPYIIINEGAINSIVAGKYSVASFGKYVSDNQVSQILHKHPSRIYVSLDTDARDQAVNLCDKLVNLSGNQVKVFLVELPDNKDASDLGFDNYMEVVRNSVEFVSKSRSLVDLFLNQYTK